MANFNTASFMSRLSFFTVLLALLVGVLGAYTRLTDGGLGCPDWPGCYGHIVVPQTQQSIQNANMLFPHTPVVAAKAWTEMVHRYAVFMLLCCISILTILAFRYHKLKRSMIIVPIMLIAAVILQVLLGMWTVTLQLLPIVVMGHLLGGFTVLALLWWLYLATKPQFYAQNMLSVKKFRFWAVLGLIILIMQIALGGWTSSNYASLACPDFPYCINHTFPLGEYSKAFNLFMPLGANFQDGVMDVTRMTIQSFHRFGALVTTIYLFGLTLGIFIVSRDSLINRIALMILFVLSLQVLLGILNVVWVLPLGIAVAHNAVAALLLLTLVTLNYVLYAKPTARFN